MSGDLLDIALAPMRLVLDPAERMWWPGLLLAGLLAAAWARASRGQVPSVRQGLRVLAHPSSRVDLGFVFVRAAMRTLALAGAPAAATVLAVQVVRGLWATVGAPPATPGGALWGVAGYSLTLFVASDASRYALHRLCHRWDALWRFHQVHHSAEVLTPLTLYRIHPVDQALQALRGVLVLGGVGGVFAWLSGGQASPWTLFGVPAAVLALNALGANLRHSHIRVAYPRSLEHVLISPAQHQVHHGALGREHQRNFGAFLAVWDWMGGTLRCSDEGPPSSWGLPESDRNHDPTRLTSLLLGPLRGH